MKNAGRIGFWLIALAALGFSAASDAGVPDQAQRTKEFVVMGYVGLQADLRANGGPYLSTLLDLLGALPSEAASVTDQVRALAEQNKNIMVFAEAVTALQRETAERPEASVNLPSGPNVVSGRGLENFLTHLTRATPLNVYLTSGDRLAGVFVEYGTGRLWLRGAARRSVPLKEILAVETR
jgi:hypothetical protein